MAVCWAQARFTVMELIGLAAMGPTVLCCWFTLSLLLEFWVVVLVTIVITIAIVGVAVILASH